MKKFKQFICSVLVFAIVITSTLIFPLSASAADAPTELSTLSAGNTVSFGGETWIVLNPTTGYLLMQGGYTTYTTWGDEITSYYFDSSGSTSYNPESTTNIAYTLNTDFYDSLGADAALVQSKTWSIGTNTGVTNLESTVTVTCNIGMISQSEANTYYSSGILGSTSYGWWTRTPFSDYGVNTRSANGDIGGSCSATYSSMVRPTLYLSPNVLVYGGNGGTVLGGIYNIPVVTGISPTEGSSQGGTEVTVTGTGLSVATAVYFGDTAGTITDTSGAALIVTAPEGTGLVDITVASAWGTSQTSSADQFQYILTQATPTFSPAGGEVCFGTVLQIISDGAEHIYYTTDGTDPSTSSTEYSDAARPVINSTMTVKAIATASGKATSEVASTSYTQAESADLTDLEISGSPGNFTFVADQYTYDDLTVVSGIESVTVTPTGTGTITVNGTEVASGTASDAIDLTEGVEKSITVVATETGKSSKTYSINITRIQPVASITKNGSTTYYDTFSTALAAANNDTVTLLRDTTETVSFTAATENTLTIDGKSHTITGEDFTGGETAALTLSGDGNVILKDLALQGGKGSTSYGLLVSGGSVNVLCEGTVNAYGALDNTTSYSTYSIGLGHRGSGSVNITNATGGLAYGSIGVWNSGTGTVNVTNATTYGSGSTSSGFSYGVQNDGGGIVNVTNASGSKARDSKGVFNQGMYIDTVAVNVTNASGGEASFLSFGVSSSDGGKVNVANATAVGGATYSATINGSANVKTGEDITNLTLNRGPGESCVLDAITIAKYEGTTIGILPVVMKDGVVYNWYSDSAKTNLFNATTVEATAEGPTVTNLYSGLPTVADSVIDISAISGVTAPVTGAVPTSSIADTTEYTATISWSPAASTFAVGTTYTATITLTPKTGYTLSGVPANFFTVAGAATTNAADSGVITAVFPETEQPIAALADSINAVTGLSASVSSSTVNVTGTATVTTASSDAALTFEIPSGVKVVWKASFSGGGSKYLLEPNGDGTFEVADGANIVNNSSQAAIYCYEGKGNLMITGGKVSTTGSGTAIGVAGDWLLTMTGGEVSANTDDSCAIFGKNSVVVTGGTVSATGTGGCQLYMGETSVYRSGILDTDKIIYNTSGVFADVSIDETVTQAVYDTSTGLTETGHNLSIGDSVTAMWAKQNGESGVSISYYLAEDTANAEKEWFLAVPGVTVTDTGSPTDSTPPTVTFVTPSGTGVAIDGNIAITFSEPMNTNTVSGAVYLSSDGGGSYGFVLTGGSWSDSDTVYTVPYSGLSYGKTYSIKAEGFKDIAGNVMSMDTSHSFTTMAEPSSTTYTVTFNKNGGNTEASPTTKTAISGGNVGTLPTAPSRSGYNFSGWNTAADGSGTAFTAATAVTANITVYAQWTAIPQSHDNDHTSSNGGSSGSTSTTTTTTPTTTVTITTGNTVPAVTSTTTTTATTGANGSAAAAVTVSQVTDAVNKAVAAAAQAGAGTAANVEIKVTAPANAKTVETSIPKAAMDAVANSKIEALTITTPIAAITFDDKALDTISKEAAGDVKVKISELDVTTLSDETKQVVGDRPVYNFSVTSGDKTISQFGGNVTVSVPYTPKAGEDINAIVIYYINAEGKPEIVSNCAYDPATGTIKFTTNHFSIYAVGYNKVTFKDVPTNAAFSKAVSFIAARGITTGTGDGKFSPEAAITRGQFIVMVMKAYGIKPDATAKDNFADAGNTYYTNYLSAAKRLGLTNGIGNNLYGPDKEITRQEMISLAYKTLKVIGALPAGTSGKDIAAYSDANQVASWAKDAMTLFAKAGIITGSDNKLSPTEKASRAEMAQVLYNLLSK